MKKIEIAAMSEWINEPTHLELAIDKEDFLNLKQRIKALTNVPNIERDVHSVDLAQEVFTIPEDSDFRQSFCALKVFPNNFDGKTYMDWAIYQSYRHKHNYEEMVESEAFTLRELAEHFNKLEEPGKYHT